MGVGNFPMIYTLIRWVFRWICCFLYFLFVLVCIFRLSPRCFLLLIRRIWYWHSAEAWMEIATLSQPVFLVGCCLWLSLLSLVVSRNYLDFSHAWSRLLMACISVCTTKARMLRLAFISDIPKNEADQFFISFSEVEILS